jgi:flagellar operon protein (TIGR03826 family)
MCKLFGSKKKLMARVIHLSRSRNGDKMAEVRNCRKCGKIFTYLAGAPICSTCKQLDEDDFKKVKDYLYENPGASITELSNQLEVSVEKIKRFLRDGRLEISGSEGNVFLECEGCGKAINSGRFCSECERSLTKDLTSAAGQLNAITKPQANNQANRDGGMRYLNKHSK